MNAQDTPPEVVAAIDEVFEHEPLTPAEAPPPPPEVPIREPDVTTPTGESAPSHGTAGPPGSPLGDYVRELQQEFEEQQQGNQVLP